MRLAICMIVKNESSCLERCLQSVMGLGNIYIVDTGSTDNTCEIARKYTSNVYENEYKWNDSFCEARNYVLAKAKEEWVLSIDADNYIVDPTIILDTITKAESEGYDAIDVILQGDGTNSTHRFPNLFKRSMHTWEGAVHNFIRTNKTYQSDIKIVYGYSAAHKLDPDRSFRILAKEVQKPGKVRELFYYAREFWYRKQYDTAIEWYNKYLEVGKWAPEIADAYLMIAKCYINQKKFYEARVSALMSLNINNDNKEALELLADACGPVNSERWLNWAYTANNKDVLFTNMAGEKNAEYYNALYKYDTPDRYADIYARAIDMSYQIPFDTALTMPTVAFDIGCGSAELSKFINNEHISGNHIYAGIDFSTEAIKQGKAKGANVSVANIYNYEYTNECMFFILEVLEHIDDLKLLSKLPKGCIVIASVPSFKDRSHIRRFTKAIILERYKDIIDIKMMERFNIKDGKWQKDGQLTNSHIILFGGTIK